jgi:hypothetical protein
MAVVSPPGIKLAEFVPPLNEGEQKVAEWLIAELDDEWTVYVQPRLHMAQPDFVCVHPRSGVVVIEVKDWADGLYRNEANHIEVLSGGRWTSTEANPRKQARDYRDLVWNDFVRSTEQDSWREKADQAKYLLIFPRMSQMNAFRLTAMELIQDENDVYGAEQRSNATAELNNLQLVHGIDFPKTLRAFFKRMVTKTFSGNNWEFGLSKLQFHLNEHEDVRERRGPLRLSKEARNIAGNPNNARVRRIRGAPGSGKSLGLASRAAGLTLDGKSVLLLSYNITMANYLADLTSWARRHETADITDEHEAQVARAHAKSRVTAVHFHGFLGGVVDPPTSKRSEAGMDEPDDSFWELWVQRATERYSQNNVGRYGESLPRYDAILIDEGQDFKESWWRLLHDHVLHDKGEIAIVCDRAQSLYEVPEWINQQSEFRGWTELKESFRLPKDVLRPVSRVLAELKKQGGGENSEYIEPELPEERQGVLWSPSRVEWINITDTSNAPSLKDWISDILKKVRADAVTTKLSAPDIVFLADTHEDGEQLVEAAIRDTGTQFQSVFDSNDKRRQQERKRSFWPGSGGYRFCTVHSFKGWESRVVVYLISERSTIKQLYVALTRLRGEPEGIPARLFVRNGKPEFNHFGDLVMSSN